MNQNGTSTLPPLTDSDLNAVREAAWPSVRLVYETTSGNKDFALTFGHEMTAIAELRGRGRLPHGLPLRRILDSALRHNIDPCTLITDDTYNLLSLLRTAYKDTDIDVDSEWESCKSEYIEKKCEQEFVQKYQGTVEESDARDWWRRCRRILEDVDNGDIQSANSRLGSVIANAEGEAYPRDEACAIIAELLADGLEHLDVDLHAKWDEIEEQRRAAQHRERRQQILRCYHDNAFDGRVMTAAVSLRGHAGPAPAIWGCGHEILWAQGEPLLIDAGYGTGKTTLAGLLARGMLCGGGVLGYPVRKLEDGVILYVAADRPDQIMRSMARQFTEEQIDASGNRLVIWRGRLPADAAEKPRVLRDVAAYYGAKVLFLDSLKDVAKGLAEDRATAEYQDARKLLLESGCQLAELHHLTKSGNDYGSVWLPAGAGSVLRLAGKPGSTTATLTQLKAPAHFIPKTRIQIDRDRGEMTVIGQESDGDAEPTLGDETAAPDLADWVAEHGPDGVTARQLVEHQRGDVNSEAALVKAKRTLNALAGDDGPLRRIDGNGRGNPTRWVLFQ